jgi:hypothetical protein
VFASIAGELDHPVADSQSFRRKDWLSLLLAAGFSLIVNDLLPVEVASTLSAWRCAARPIAHVRCGLPLLPLASSLSRPLLRLALALWSYLDVETARVMPSKKVA